MPDSHLLYQAPEKLPPFVQACFHVAQRLHDGETRKKPNGVKLDYVTHPIATLNILLHSGETDEVTLGAALLHDVIEDCKQKLDLLPGDREHTKPRDSEDHYGRILTTLLRNELENASSEQGWSRDTMLRGLTFAADVTHYVKELSAENGLGDRKRVLRAIGALNYSPRAAKIKLAELSASMADDIIHAPMRADSPDEQLLYNDRVWAVAKCAAHVADSKKERRERDPSVQELFKFMRHLHDEHCVLLDYPEAVLNEEEKQELRRSFNLEQAWIKAQKLPKWDQGEEAMLYAAHGDIENKKSGIVQIGVTEHGDVTRIRIVFDPNSEDERFQMINRLTRLIEGDDHENAVGYGKTLIQVGDGPEQQLKLKLRKPITMEKFIEFAAKSGAMDREEDKEFIDLVEKVTSIFKEHMKAPARKGNYQRLMDELHGLDTGIMAR